MAFDTLRKNKPPRSKLCSFCQKNERDGKVEICIKDNETKVVTSQGLGACEGCAIKQYGAAKEVLDKAVPAGK